MTEETFAITETNKAIAARLHVVLDQLQSGQPWRGIDTLRQLVALLPHPDSRHMAAAMGRSEDDKAMEYLRFATADTPAERREEWDKAKQA